MRVTRKMLAPSLRSTGTKLRLVPINREWQFRLLQKIIVKKLRHQQPANSEIQMTEVSIPRRDGQQIRTCVYQRADLDISQPVTGLLWLHGGGYAFGIPEIETTMIERLIQTSNTVVVSPDYRLSLEAPYPAALHDAYDTLVWMQQHAQSLGIRPNQLAVGGESAGGGLACCVAAYARDVAGVPIAFQIPLYPMLDDRMQTASMIDNNAPVWTAKANVTAWRLYLGPAFQTDQVSAYAAPARLTNFAGLPPLVSFVGSVEPFYDEVQQYVSQLRSAGVPARLSVYQGAFHGFDQLAADSPVAKLAVKTLMADYQDAVQTCFA